MCCSVKILRVVSLKGHFCSQTCSQGCMDDRKGEEHNESVNNITGKVSKVT